MNPRLLLLIDPHGIRTLTILASSPDEEAEGERLLSKIRQVLEQINRQLGTDVESTSE